jgi:IS5 family transposase
VVPWSALCRLIAPFYPKPGNGRPPVGVERMLRLYFLQQWFNLSDPAVEEALYDSSAMRGFVGIDLGREPVPDETTVCRFRHLLEAHDLGQRLFEEVQRHLSASGLQIATGTIVDATIISAPPSTKNAAKARDPEMHQTKKGSASRSRHTTARFCSWIRVSAQASGVARPSYASWQRNRCRRAMNRLASAQVTMRRCAFFLSPR